MHNLGGARGANSPPFFLLSKNRLFWLRSGRGANKRIELFLNDYLGGVKTEKMNLHFMIHILQFLTPWSNPPPANVISQVTLVVTCIQ